MPYTSVITSPSGSKFKITFEGDQEPTQDEIDDAINDLTAREADTGQDLVSSAGGAAARGALGLVPSAIQGFGAMIPGDGGEDIRARGKAMQGSLERTFPVNPTYEDTIPVKAAGAVGQGVSFLGAALTAPPSAVLGLAGLAGAASGADIADELDLTGVRRGIATLGYGAAEVASERLFGIGSPKFLKGAGRPMLEAAKAVGGETVEEPIAGALQDLARNAAVIGTDKPMVNPLDPAKRFEEAAYGAVGALAFGGVAGVQARRLQDTKLVAQVEGQYVELPKNITEQEMADMGIKPDQVSVIRVDPALERAAAKAPTPGAQQTIQEVMLGAADKEDPFINAETALADFDALEEETPPETTNPAMEGSAPGGVGDLATSDEGTATGSSAPSVSVSNSEGIQESVNTENTLPPIPDGYVAVLHKAAPEMIEEISKSGLKYRSKLSSTAHTVSKWDDLKGVGGIDGVWAAGQTGREPIAVFMVPFDEMDKHDSRRAFTGVPGPGVVDAAQLSFIIPARDQPTTVADLATSDVTAKRNVNPAAFRAQRIAEFQQQAQDPDIEPAPQSLSSEDPPPTPLADVALRERLARYHRLSPRQVTIVNRPDLKANGWIHKSTGMVYINAPRIKGPAHLDETIYHEYIHRAEYDPAFQRDIKAAMSAFPRADLDQLDAAIAKAGYDINEVPTERQAVALSRAAVAFRRQPGFTQLIQRIKTWFKQQFGRPLNQKDAEAIAMRILAKTMAEARAGQPVVTNAGTGNVRRSDDIRFSRPLDNDIAASPAFYSKLERVVGGANVGKSQPGEQWANWIKNQGLTQDELKWTGVVPWLETKGKAQVTKAELMEYLQGDGAVKFEEVVLTDAQDPTGSLNKALEGTGYTAQIDDDTGDVTILSDFGEGPEPVLYDDLPSNIQRIVNNRSPQQNQATKYGQYKLPGGENYREVVLTMAGGVGEVQVISFADGSFKLKNSSGFIKTKEGDDFVTQDGTKAIKVRDLYNQKVKKSDYTSSHFEGVPNYVAHYRAQDFGDGTVIEEIQSDRHQAGRKKGYREPFEEWVAYYTTPDGKDVPLNNGKTSEEALKGVENGWEKLVQIKTKKVGEGVTDGTPDAPYRKTWPLQLFKRALREAVESGKDWIGWPAGSIVADRFSLRKQVESIQYRDYDKHLSAFDIGGNAVIEQRVETPEALADLIGKEAAERLLQQPPVDGNRTLSGEQLEVGGEGMQGFYDEILPKEVGKYVRQWGAKVEKGGLETDDRLLIEHKGTDGQWVQNAHVAPGVAERILADRRRIAPVAEWRSRKVTEPSPIWRVDFTPELKEAVMGGQVKFSRPLELPGPVDPSGPTSQVFGEAGTSAVVPGSITRATVPIRTKFFNSQEPVSPEQTSKALGFINRYLGNQTGPALAAEVKAAVEPEDQNLANGILRAELHAYGLALLEQGDSSIYEIMQRYSTTDFVIGLDEAGKPITYRRLAQELAGNSRLPGRPSDVARDMVNTEKEKANTKVLPPKAMKDITRTVDGTKLGEEDLKAIGDTVLPGGETLRKKVKRLAKPKPAAEAPPAEEEGEGEVTPEIEEESPEDTTAERYIDRVDQSQVEVLSPETAPNQVLQYIRQQELAGWRPKDAFVASTTAGLVGLGVTQDVARRTAERVWLRKEAIRDNKARRRKASGSNTSSAESFISNFDTKQTETLIPKKEDNAATKILKSAVGINRSVEQDVFTRDVTAELMRVGVPRAIAVNAANRAWQAREIRMAKRASRLAAASKSDKAKEVKATGASLLDQLAKSQSDTPPASKAKQADEVRKVYREALKLNYSDQALETWLEGRLSALDVPANIRKPLNKTIVRERAIRKAISNSEGDILKRTEKLATGETGSLAGLEKLLAETPSIIQRNTSWRRAVTVKYFMQTGLSEAQAKVAARAYEKLFADRLQQATENAVNKLLASNAPWARKIATTRGVRKKAVSDEVKKLFKAVRLGITDPKKIWDEELAKEHGWRGFTAKQHHRLQQIDHFLTSEDTLNYHRAMLIHEVNSFITEANPPPTVANQILASYVASALGGLSTFTVQASAHIGGILSTGAIIMRNPTSVMDIGKMFAQSAKTTYHETKFAGLTNAYRTEILDNLQGYEKPLEHLLKTGRKNYQSKDPATRLKGVAQMVVGYQDYVMRGLNSIDQGFIAGAAEMATLVGTRDVLKRLGMTRQQLAQLTEEAMRAKADIYEEILTSGEAPHVARAAATDLFMRKLYETVANREGTMDGLTMEEWAQDIQLAAIRESEGRTGRVSQGVSPTDEGFVRRIISYPLSGITEAMGKGGGLALYMRSVYGFMAIPFRSAAWYAGYSPYGFLRYGLHKVAEARGKTSPYQQSYATRTQERQRLREAAAGSVAMAMLAALASPSADDDENTPNALFVTGGGPGPNDAAYKDAWMKRFKPYSIVLKIDGKYHALNYGRVGESLGWAATLAGSLDDVALSKKNKESRGGELDVVDALFGNLMGNFAERSAFRGISKVTEMIGKAKQPGNTDRVASQGAFAASAIIPWKSAVNTVQRAIADPVDNEGVKASIFAAIPVAGPLINKPRVNVLGDPAGDLSPGGRAFSLGMVSFGSPEGGRAYDLIMHHGRGPSAYLRNDFSKRYEEQDTDNTFYEFSRRRGKRIKAALEDNYDRLKTVDADTFGEFLRRLSKQVNADTANELNLKQTTVE